MATAFPFWQNLLMRMPNYLSRYIPTMSTPPFMKTANWVKRNSGISLAAEPDATIVHGFKAPTTQIQVQQAIEQVALEELLHEETISAGDVIFVPAGTVHAIGKGVMLYELQEYSDITYRLYDYGRLTTNGTPRALHIERSLAVAHYIRSPQVKAQPVSLTSHGSNTQIAVCAACQYFVTREITLMQQNNSTNGYIEGKTSGSCILLSSLGAEIQVLHGDTRFV